jgi:bifunctional non-homologous end joining protein LigD
LDLRSHFDGYRALALRGGPEIKLLSRNQKDLGKKFPEILDAIASLDIQDAVVDGEIVALDDQGRSSFQALQAFDMDTERSSLVFYASDLLRLNGKDLRDLPIEARKANWQSCRESRLALIRYSVSLTEDIKELLVRVKGIGLEGPNR